MERAPATAVEVGDSADLLLGLWPKMPIYQHFSSPQVDATDDSLNSMTRQVHNNAKDFLQKLSLFLPV